MALPLASDMQDDRRYETHTYGRRDPMPAEPTELEVFTKQLQLACGQASKANDIVGGMTGRLFGFENLGGIAVARPEPPPGQLGEIRSLIDNLQQTQDELLGRLQRLAKFA